MAGNQAVGTVYIQRELFGPACAGCAVRSLVALIALATGFLVAVLLTQPFEAVSRRHRSSSFPPRWIAWSSSGDYSMRAQATTGDEVGRLVHSFNTMLEVIQKKDSERNDAAREVSGK